MWFGFQIICYVLLNSNSLKLSLHLFPSVFLFVDEPQPLSQSNGPLLAPGPLPPLTTPPTPPMDSPVSSACPLIPTPTPPPSSTSPGCSGGGSEQAGPGQLISGGSSASASSSPSNPETEEDKAKKLLYCSLCKVAVNSLSQLEAHNKGGSSSCRNPVRSSESVCYRSISNDLLIMKRRKSDWLIC